MMLLVAVFNVPKTPTNPQLGALLVEVPKYQPFEDSLVAMRIDRVHS